MKNKPTEFLELLEGFLHVYLPCSVGVSANTVKSYKDAFRLLLKFMHEKKHINADGVAFADLDYGTMLDFLSWLETERGCGISTRNQRLSALLSFAGYAQNRSLDAAAIFRYGTKKLPSKRCPGRARAVFSLEETAFLLDLPKSGSATGFRDKTLLRNC
jgi:site-specific recombinase XerD